VYRRGCQEKEDVADEWVGYLLKTDVHSLSFSVSMGVYFAIVFVYHHDGIRPKVNSVAAYRRSAADAADLR